MDDFRWLSRCAGGEVHRCFCHSIRGPNHAGTKIEPSEPLSEAPHSCGLYPLATAKDAQHVPEIKQASGARTLTMTPVLAPMPRGILSTVALRPASGRSADEAHDVLAKAYEDEPFVFVLPPGQQPRTSATAGSNAAHLQVVVDQDSGRIVVTCALDNLGKGAAGQALQNANVMLGLPESAGLTVDGVAP